MILRTEWTEARRQFSQRHSPPALIARMEAIALDDFERLCGSPSLADVASMVDGFIDALQSEGVDPVSLDIYREAIERFLHFTISRERIAA